MCSAQGYLTSYMDDGKVSYTEQHGARQDRRQISALGAQIENTGKQQFVLLGCDSSVICIHSRRRPKYHSGQ